MWQMLLVPCLYPFSSDPFSAWWPNLHLPAPALLCLRAFSDARNGELMPLSPHPHPSSPQSITDGSWYVNTWASLPIRWVVYTSSDFFMELSFSWPICLITYPLLTSFFLLSAFLFSLLVLPRVLFQVNALNSNPCLSFSFWESLK